MYGPGSLNRCALDHFLYDPMQQPDQVWKGCCVVITDGALCSSHMHPLEAMKGNTMARKAKISAVVIVWLDLAVNVIHALSHIGANIWLSFLGNAFIVVVILIAPLVSLFLLHTARLEWPGALL